MADITMSPGVALPDGDLILPDFTKHAEFKIHTAAAEIVRDDSDHNPLVRAIGSSTIKDRQQDTMEYPALQSMQKAEPGLAIFVNHSYNVPEDLVGKLAAYPEISISRDIADLHLGIELMTRDFPRAADLYKGIRNGVKMGISIGCMIKAAEWRDKAGKTVNESNIDIWDVIENRVFMHIMDVEPLEWSFVGIPANQRSWVQCAAQGLFRRSVKQGDPDMRLAPLVRAWFPDDYGKDVATVGDKSLRAKMQQIAPRVGDKSNIIWYPQTKDFALTTRGEAPRPLNRDAVATLLQRQQDTPLPDATKATDDDAKAAQEARSKKYGIGIKDGGHVTKPSKWQSLDDASWGDPCNYAYPCPDAAHARNALSRWGDADNRKQYTDAEQKIIGDRIEKLAKKLGVDVADDKGMEPAMTKTADMADVIIKGSGGDITIKADGSHGAYTGTHSHAHTAGGDQGDDATHEHEHTHDGDATHGHKHEKATEPDKTAATPLETPAVIPDTTEPTATPTAAPHVPSVVTQNLDPAQAGLLIAYNHIGKQLGFAERDLTKKDIVDNDTDGQQVITLVSQLDAITDTLAGVNLYGVCALVDQLMDVLNIPDADRGDMGYMGYSAKPDVTKAGSRNSAADQKHIQAIHDHAAAAGAECSGYNGQTAAEDPMVQDSGQMSVLPDVAKSLDSLSSSLASLADVPAFLEQVNTAKGLLESVQGQIATAQEHAEAIKQANAAAQAKLDALTSTPLGRPIPTGTSAKAADPAAMPAIVQQQQTDPSTGLERRYVEGIGHCTVWPDGYFAGTRPPLTRMQEIVMDQMPGGLENKHSYLAGKSVLVPVA